MEIKQYNTYIFKGKTIFSSPFKGKVLEMTETSILVENLDANKTFRSEIKDFNNRYKSIELIEDWYEKIKKLTSELKFVPVASKKGGTVNVQRPYIEKTCGDRCFCDGSCTSTYIFWEG